MTLVDQPQGKFQARQSILKVLLLHPSEQTLLQEPDPYSHRLERKLPELM